MKRNSTIVRFTALSLAIFMMANILAPTVVYAINTGPTQPEVIGYQGEPSSENVNQVSGQFSYSIPVTSVPEYPMTVTYNSSPGYETESSAYGYGFSSFSGAIMRSTVGIPDDICNGVKNYTFTNQPNTDLSMGGAISAGTGVVGASVYMQGGFNNYTGFYASIGASVGVTPIKGAKVVGISVGLDLDSRQDGVGISAGAGIPFFDVLKVNGQVGVTKKFDNAKWAVGSDFSEYFDIGITRFSTNMNNNASLPQLANVNSLFTSRATSLFVTFPIPPACVIWLTFTTAYSKTEFYNENKNMYAYGYGHLQDGSGFNRTNRNQIADFSVEGENSYSGAKNSPAYMQKDYFTVNCAGLSGNMQLFQDEYGVFNRNYDRFQARNNVLPISKTTDRKEVYAWDGAYKAVLNKDLDVLSLLKGGNNSDNDFDNTVFIQEKGYELNGPNKKFGSKPKFRMRGDLAGEFNISSQSYKDNAPNIYSRVDAPNASTNNKLIWFGIEGGMPAFAYEPDQTAAKSAYNSNTPKPDFKRSTQIDYFTVEDVAKNADQNTCTSINLNNSFYTHSAVDQTFNKGSEDLITAKKGLNIITDIINVKKDDEIAKKTIADIRVKNAAGLTYIFNLPVYAKGSKSLSMTGGQKTSGDAINRNCIAPVASGDNSYNSLKYVNTKKDRNKLVATDTYEYPYAWLLTAMVGADYIDFDNIPGPSDGDLGYWVKFKYIQTSDTYTWRNPITGLDHLPGVLQNQEDDYFLMQGGQKEVYYLQAIETRGHVSNYTLQQRLDGISAPKNADKSFNLYNGDAKNTLTEDEEIKPAVSQLGNDFQFAVSKIELYKKETKNVKNPYDKQLIRSSVFSYDYSCFTNIPNNYNTATRSITNAYKTGKLTLRKIQDFVYDEAGVSHAVPSHTFTYSFDDDTKYNVNYDRKLIDIWRNFLPSADNKDADDLKGIYVNYNELSKAAADENAKAISLTGIGLPSGGQMNVSYEAGGYAKVQDKEAFVMRRINKIEQVGGEWTADVDVSDLVEASGGTLPSSLNLINTKLLDNGGLLEACFYLDQKDPDKNAGNFYRTWRGETFKNTVGVITLDAATGRYFQKVTFTGKPNVVNAFSNYALNESNQVLYVKQMSSGVLSSNSCDKQPQLAEMAGIENADPLSAILSAADKINKMFIPASEIKVKYKTCFEDPEKATVYSHLSFLRTPVYKEKYTGQRVKSISMSDNFAYASDLPSGKKPNIYTTNYTYETSYYPEANNPGARQISSGVATIEPGGGISTVFDSDLIAGINFYTAPAIHYAKVATETGYAIPKSVAKTVNQVIPRYKGKTITEFYTAKDNHLKFTDNFSPGNATASSSAKALVGMVGILSWIKLRIFRRTFRIPLPVPINVMWHRIDNYNQHSYAYRDYTDLLGRVKSVKQMGETSATPKLTQTYNYFEPEEGITVLDGTNEGAAIDPYKDPTRSRLGRPGRVDQTWSEAYYTKESAIKLIYPILFMHAKTERNFSYTNMKYTYLPPVLKEVVTTQDDGQITTTAYQKFDGITGQVVETKYVASDGKVKLSRVVPAYWKYKEMGPQMRDNPNQKTYANNLLATTATYDYLGATPNTSTDVLSVGITEWSHSDWSSPAEVLLQTINPVTGNATYKAYNQGDLSNVQKGITSINVNICPQLALSKSAYSNFEVNGHIRDKYLYMPVRSYTYDADLSAAAGKEGSFAIPADFDYSTSAARPAAWKLLSSNTLFSSDGDVVESKDLLNKYASQRLGYSFSNNIASVSNAPFQSTVFEGAECIYPIANGKAVDNASVNLGNAVPVTTDCNGKWTSRVLNWNTANVNRIVNGVPGNGPISIVFTAPAGFARNVTLARMQVTFNSLANPSRYFNFQVDDNNKVRILTEYGEEFLGYYQYALSTGNGLQAGFVMSPRDFNAMSVVPATQGTLQITRNLTSPVCIGMPDVPYRILSGYCAEDVHTGKSAFMIIGAGTGTSVNISKASLPAGEYNRKFTAMVWVHKSSPDETALVIENPGGSKVTSTKQAPYLTAGDWSLLRVEFNPGNTASFNVYVTNTNANGIVTYDDLRVLPYQAEMTATVYDHVFGRVTATLDKNNFATWYEYDERGRLLQLRTEIAGSGPKIVKQYLYNEQKKN